MSESVVSESLGNPDAGLLRRGLRVSFASLVWTLVTGAITVLIGITSESLVLIAFGLTGALDAAGSAALVVHFRHALRHDSLSDAHERVALMIVSSGLVVVAVATLLGSAHRLITGGHSSDSWLGVGIAAASCLVLAALSRVKRQLGAEIPSPALQADGMLSLTGAVLAAVTVVGTLLAEVGWWWADPIAAILVALGALVVVRMLHADAR